MVNEKYKLHMFFTVFILTVVVFSSGIVLGYFLDRARVSDVMGMVKQNELSMESYVLEQDFLDVIGGEESCSLLEPSFAELSRDLAKIGTLLTSYEKSKLFKKEDYDYLKIRYFNLEIQSYLLSLKLKEQCSLNKTIVLYFYMQEHPSSLRQGFILDNLVDEYGFENISIYSFDKDFENTPLVDMVERHYNITTAPSLIIDNDVKVSGLIEEEDLNQLVSPFDLNQISNSN